MKRLNKIIHNRIRCKNCGEIIESKTRHDWACCRCFHESNGVTGCFVDGGTDYLWRGGQPEYIEEMYEVRPYTEAERDEYNQRQEALAKQYKWIKVDYME